MAVLKLEILQSFAYFPCLGDPATYVTPNTSEETSSFVHNQKFVLTIRNLCSQSEICVDNQKFVLAIRITLLIILRYKMHSQICKVVTLTTNSLNLDI